MTPVERIRLAPDLEISRILTGLWQIADLERDGSTVDLDEAARAMGPYLDAGLTTFDMADHYGSAEDIIGALRRQRRSGDSGASGDSSGFSGSSTSGNSSETGSSLGPGEFLTKWVPTPGQITPETVRAGVETAIQRMGGRPLDLLQLHAWAYWHPEWIDALFELAKLRREGLLRHIGLTNFDTAHARMVLATGLPVVSNQVCFSLIDRRPMTGLSPLCAATELKLLCYGTIAGGLLTERWLGKRDVAADDMPTWSLMKYRRFIEAAEAGARGGGADGGGRANEGSRANGSGANEGRARGGWDALQALLETQKSIADERGVSMANVAIRWVLQQPGVAGAIVGARLGRSEHIDDTLRTFSFELSPEECARLEAAAAQLGTVPGDSGDEYRRPPFLTAAGDLSDHLDELPAPYPVEAAADPQRAHPHRQVALSGTEWESLAGYSRAMRTGSTVRVSGTTATHGPQRIGGGDPASQTHFIIDKLEGALRSLGARLEDVVRTRIFVDDLDDWEPVARAHGQRFAHIKPANTLVQARLVGEGYRVEIEADAEITPRD